MPSLDLKTLVHQLSSPQHHPSNKLHNREKSPLNSLYLLMGEEHFLIEEAITAIKESIFSTNKEALDFNFHCFFGGDDEVGKIREALDMFPIMHPKRLVLLRQAHKLKEHEWELLLSVLSPPMETTVIIFVADKIDKRKKFYKKLEPLGTLVELPKPYDHQINEWMGYILKKAELSISREAQDLLRYYVGPNLTELYHEIFKLKEYLNDRCHIETQDVMATVSQTRADKVFDFTHALGHRHGTTALKSLTNLIEHGQNTIGILAMVTRHFRILTHLHQGMKDRLSSAQLCAQVGIPQFFLKDYQSQVHHWTEEKLFQTIGLLKETDKALKSSSVSGHFWLEHLVLQICKN